MRESPSDPTKSLEAHAQHPTPDDTKSDAQDIGNQVLIAGGPAAREYGLYKLDPGGNRRQTGDEKEATVAAPNGKPAEKPCQRPHQEVTNSIESPRNVTPTNQVHTSLGLDRSSEPQATSGGETWGPVTE